MNNSCAVARKIKNSLVRTVGFATTALAVALVLANALQCNAQAKSQASDATVTKFEYEVVSIKPIVPGQDPSGFGAAYSPEGLDARGVSMWWLLPAAYGVQRNEFSQAPKWFDSVRFNVEAKMSSATADEMQKLNPDQLNLARQHMLQAILADRFMLSLHRETKDLPAYFLVIAKNGPKLQGAKPDYIGPNDMPDLAGNRAIDKVFITKGGQFTGQAASIKTLVDELSREVGRPVLDKTGLTGKYDFTFKFARDDLRLQGPHGGTASDQPAPAVSDPSGGPTLFTALQQYLGLKLESGKGPVEIIVIDHVERPSGN
jgi:uncharacterized protein (TIGR03435 family)